LLRSKINLDRAVGGRVLTDVVIQADLHDRRDVHAGTEEEDVAERVVAHLPAHDVPGQREQNHHPQHRQLKQEVGKQHGCEHTQE
jgi:hypothetical protein